MSKFEDNSLSYDYVEPKVRVKAEVQGESCPACGALPCDQIKSAEDAIAEYERRAAVSYIPDIPGSKVLTLAEMNAKQRGFSLGLYAGKMLMAAIFQPSK